MPHKKCEHDKVQYYCKECNGKGICEHGKRKYRCVDCEGSSICEHKQIRYRCLECGGNEICEHDKRRYDCIECGGSGVCQHKIRRSFCRICVGSQICEHDRIKSVCHDCEGGSICEHGKRRPYCVDCNGSQICEHKKNKSICPDCFGSRCCKGHLDKTTLCYTVISNLTKYRGYCVKCFQYLFPDEEISTNYGLKEKSWVDFIKKKFTNYTWQFNKSISYGCSRYRPDALLDMGSHIIVAEHDEDQHTRMGYSCEDKRIMAIMQDCGFRPVVVIRFNPDDYIDEDGNNVTSCWGLDKNGKIRIKPSKKHEYNDRLNKFQTAILESIQNIPKREVTEIKLFYSNVA